MSKKIVITGANGFIGHFVANKLANEGHEILGLVRHLYKAPIKNISLRKFDLYNFGSDIVPEGTEIFIHTAYVKSNSNYENDINIKAAQRLFEICKRKKVKQFIFISSLSASKNAVSKYGKSKFKIEEIIKSDETLILSPGLVIGNGGLYSNIRKIISQNKIIPIIAKGKQPLQYLYIEDLAKIIEISITQNITGHYFIANSKTINNKKLYKTISQQLGKKIFLLNIPYFFSDILFYFIEKFNIKIGINKDNYLGLKHSKEIKVCNIEKEFGIKATSI